MSRGPAITQRETELRRLCFWYECSQRPSAKIVAEVLQDAADAVQYRALSPDAADMLIAVWAPFADREASAGNPPPSVTQVQRLATIRAAVADVTRMVKEAAPEKRPALARLLREQLEILEREERKAKWPTT